MQNRYYNFIYNNEKKVVFTYVPKVACSNWKGIMRYLEGYENYLDTTYAHNRKISGLTYLDQMPQKEDIIRDQTIRKLTCVRDPYSRALSAYLNKVESRMLAKSNPKTRDHFFPIFENVEEYRATTLDQSKHPEVSFEVFLMWLDAKYSHYTQDEHWRSQTELLCYDHVAYDFIGRFEKLSTDAQRILDKMGCDIGFPTQEEIRFSPMGTGTKMDEYYNERCFDLVEKIYSNDFANFSYPTESGIKP